MYKVNCTSSGGESRGPAPTGIPASSASVDLLNRRLFTVSAADNTSINPNPRRHDVHFNRSLRRRRPLQSPRPPPGWRPAAAPPPPYTVSGAADAATVTLTTPTTATAAAVDNTSTLQLQSESSSSSSPPKPSNPPGFAALRCASSFFWAASRSAAFPISLGAGSAGLAAALCLCSFSLAASS